MKQVDYIVVGLGLAGLAFCEKLLENHKSFLVFDTAKDAASRVAAGVYNPVILKRYTLPYKAEEQLDLAKSFYKNLGDKLDERVAGPMPVLKILSSVADQNQWFEASDKPGVGRFVKPRLEKPVSTAIKAPYLLGEVQESGRVDIPALLDVYRAYLASAENLISEPFDHDRLQIQAQGLSYGNIISKKIVFAEGYAIKMNPYFKNLPLIGNKGEYLIIKAPNLQLRSALKGGVFIVPLGGDHYKVGATFNWQDKDYTATATARNEIIEKLNKMINCPFEVVDQIAGIRPTTGDRRPLIGSHPKYDALAVLNGLGTRGTMMGPYLANLLFDYLENGLPIPQELSISRFATKMQ